MCKCQMPDGLVIKPDGVNELDPCIYEIQEVYSNVVVEISKCRKCGHTNISWYRGENTQKIPVEEWEEIINN